MADPLTDVLDKKAAFSQTFSGTTNLSQRRRYAQDISAAQDNRDEVNERTFNARLQNDPAFARTMTARDRLQLDRESRLRDDDLAERRFTFDMEKTTRMEKLNRDKFDLDLQRERRMLEKEEEGLQEAKRITADTEFLEKAERDLRHGRGLFPGDPEYAKSAMDLLIRHPYAAPALRKSLVDAMRVDMDPEEVAFELKEISAQGLEPRISITTDAFGKKKRTLTGVPRKDSDPAAVVDKQFGEAQIRYDKAIDNLKAIGSEIKTEDDGLNEDRTMLRELAADARSELKHLRGERAKSLSGSGNGNQAVDTPVGAAAPTAPLPAAEPAQSAGGPAVGFVDEGFRFKGGNPRDKNNWEPVK